MVGRWNFLWGPGLFSGAKCWFQGGYMRIYFWGCHFFLISGTIWLPFICQIPLTDHMIFSSTMGALVPLKDLEANPFLHNPFSTFGCWVFRVPCDISTSCSPTSQTKKKQRCTPFCDGNPPFPQEKTAVHRLRFAEYVAKTAASQFVEVKFFAPKSSKAHSISIVNP